MPPVQLCRQQEKTKVTTIFSRPPCLLPGRQRSPALLLVLLVLKLALFLLGLLELCFAKLGFIAVGCLLIYHLAAGPVSPFRACSGVGSQQRHAAAPALNWSVVLLNQEETVDPEFHKTLT